MSTGVLALQGAFALHQRMLESLGERVVLVRRPEALSRVDRLVLPGGESTTMSMLAERTGLLAPLADAVGSGMPVLATCAGTIMLAARIRGGRDDQHCLAALDITVRRNGFGSQIHSFVEPIHVDGLDEHFPAVCIRAPVIEETGPSVRSLARIDGRPAMVCQGAIMACIFHPELADDTRLHQAFLQQRRLSEPEPDQK